MNHSDEFEQHKDDLPKGYDIKYEQNMDNNLQMMHSDLRIKTPLKFKDFRQSISQRTNNKYGGK